MEGLIFVYHQWTIFQSNWIISIKTDYYNNIAGIAFRVPSRTSMKINLWHCSFLGLLYLIPYFVILLNVTQALLKRIIKRRSWQKIICLFRSLFYFNTVTRCLCKQLWKAIPPWSLFTWLCIWVSNTFIKGELTFT